MQLIIEGCSLVSKLVRDKSTTDRQVETVLTEESTALLATTVQNEL